MASKADRLHYLQRANRVGSETCGHVAKARWRKRVIPFEETQRNQRKTRSWRRVNTALTKGGRSQRQLSFMHGVPSPRWTLSLPSLKSTFSQPFKQKMYKWGNERIGSIIIFHLSKRWKAKFSILCDVIFLVKLQGKFEVDHSWDWEGLLSADTQWVDMVVNCINTVISVKDQILT